jgi:alpha-tubulin suppressor-like RCC1 family protein
VLRRNGTVLCWGLNQFGGIGDGTISGDKCSYGSLNYFCRTAPTPVVGLNGVTHIDAGTWHSCAITSDGSLWCWGRNDLGQLGHSSGDATCTDPQPATSFACNPTPTRVEGFPAGVKIAQVSCGIYHTCAVTTVGDVYCWGQNSYGALGAPLTTTSSTAPLRVTGFSSAAVEVKTSVDHTMMSCARLADTSVWCWGQGDYGELGRDPVNDATSGSHPYHEVPKPVLDAQSNALGQVASLQAGLGGCVLKTNGTVWCWGFNGQGLLGTGGADLNVHFPAQQVVLGLPSTVAAISRRDATVLALDKDGNVWGWGRNNYAMIGDGTVAGDAICSPICKGTPAKLPNLSGVLQIAMGESNGFVLKTDGTVWGWGGNNYGTCGHPPKSAGDGACGASSTADDICNPSPTRVTGLP